MVSIEHLSVDYYRRGQVVHAVRDFSLTIKPGETVGLVGESGSGKSTVALSILRLIRPQEGRIVSGRILYKEEDLLSISEERLRTVRGKRISMIFQDPFTALNPVMRVREQMEEMFPPLPSRERTEVRDGVVVGSTAGPSLIPTFPRTTSGTGALEEVAEAPVSLEGRRSLQQAIAQALERVQLDPARVLESYPHQLSGGQRQRVMIAMALLGTPDLVLADEPTTALDMLVQKEILDLLFRLQKEMNLAILLISHNLSLVAHYTQQLVVMQNGEAVEKGASKEVLLHPRHPYTQSLIGALRRLTKVI